MSILIIAEAGVNHNGDLTLARKMIDLAAEAGADIVKFQTFRADRLSSIHAKKAAYQLQAGGGAESQYQMLKHLEMSDEMHLELIDHCVKKNIKFLSTAFDIQGVHFLKELGAKLFKIPSGEITNLPYLRSIGAVGKPVILSTGMSNFGDIELAIHELEKSGLNRSSITVLHCTTEYPTPMNEVNLRAMLSIGAAFGVPIGYSDHTSGIEVSIAAAALGATVIEKHFTLSKKLSGPDHKASLEPDELISMIRAIRNIEFALGDGVKRVTSGELMNRSVVRKSIVAGRFIKAGEIMDESNLAIKRPEGGLSPLLWDQVLGKIAKKDFSPDEFVEI